MLIPLGGPFTHITSPGLTVPEIPVILSIYRGGAETPSSRLPFRATVGQTQTSAGDAPAGPGPGGERGHWAGGRASAAVRLLIVAR